MRANIWTGIGAALLCAMLGCDKQADEVFDDTPLTPDLAAGTVVETLTIEIAPYKRGCRLLEDSTCLVAEAIDDDEVGTYGYDFVWGLDYAWGYRYLAEINVVKMPDDTVDGDGNVWNYELVEVVSVAPELGASFTLPAYTFGDVPPGESYGELVDATPFVCTTPLLCTLLGDTSGGELVRVGFGAQPEAPLVVLEML